MYQKKEGLNIAFDPDWLFDDLFKKSLKNNPNINNILVGDHYYGFRSLGASVYARDIHMFNDISVYDDTSIEDEAINLLKSDSMLSLDNADIETISIDGAIYDESIEYPNSNNIDDVLLFDYKKALKKKQEQLEKCHSLLNESIVIPKSIAEFDGVCMHDEELLIGGSCENAFYINGLEYGNYKIKVYEVSDELIPRS